MADAKSLGSEVDLGMTWEHGFFVPTGAGTLDKALVNENLDWLRQKGLENVLKPFEKGLRHFLEARKQPERLSDTLTDVYEAFESMAKVTLENDKDLSANREAFISRLKLDAHWSKMLRDFIDYGCEYRHGVEEAKQRPQPKPEEVEAFIYTAGLFIRLAIKRLEAESQTDK
jgi:hypothetical protein